MDRVLEPELMLNLDQAAAYAAASFEEPHRKCMALLFENFLGICPKLVLDLGCGPGDITHRLARMYPTSQVVGVDASPAMLSLANKRRIIERVGNLEFVEGRIPDLPQNIVEAKWDLIVATNILHHLPDPSVFWRMLKQNNWTRIPFFLSDLHRPEDEEMVKWCVNEYAREEPEIHIEDYRNSLRAAFTLDEIDAQLHAAGLPFNWKRSDPTHLCVFGNVP